MMLSNGGRSPGPGMAAVVFLLAGCAAQFELPEQETLRLAPTAQAALVTLSAAVAWHQAAGVSYDIVPEGSENATPVGLVPVARNLEGEAVCGTTKIAHLAGRWRVLRIEISTDVDNCGTPLETLTHELGHAFAGSESDHPDCGPDSAMYPWSQTTALDDCAVDWVCETALCYFASE